MSYLVLQKSPNGRSYAYRVTAHWDSSKGRSVQEREYLGSVTADGCVVPGRRRGQEDMGVAAVPIDEARRLVREHRPLGEGSAPRLPASPSPVTAVTDPGCLHLCVELARAIGLTATLCEVFGADRGRQLAILAAYQTAQGTPLYLARQWMERSMGEKMLHAMRLGGDGELLEAIGADTPLRMCFFRAWLGRRNRPKSLVYDITSLSTYSELLDIAEYGYNRNGEALPQINLASVHDRLDGLPLFYRILPGSIGDVSTLKLTAELVRDFGLDDFHFVLDRGFCSQANMQQMLAGGIGFTMAVPLTSRQARHLVGTLRARLPRPKNAFAWRGEPMHHLPATWSVKVSDADERTLPAHLYLNPQRQSDERARLLARILLAEERAAAVPFPRKADARAWIEDNAHGLNRHLAVRPVPGGGFRIMRKNHAIAARCAGMGLTLIVTTDAGMDREQVLAEYRSRDRVEKAFDIFKNENGQDRLHISTRDQAEGRVFLAFLALAIACEMDRRMRESRLYKQYTVAEVMAELGKIRALHCADGTVRVLEITKAQRNILQKLGVPPVGENLVIN